MGSQYDDGPSVSTQRATSAIIDAYLESLQARREYTRASGNDFGEDAKTVLHRQLQDAVLSYYEAIRYQLKTKTSVSKYWEDVVLWTETRYKRDEVGDVVTDGDGRALVEEIEITGLQTLDAVRDDTEIVTEKSSNAFGEGAVNREVSRQLPTDVLFRIARYLDEAAEKLGLLADAETPTASPEEAEV